MNSARLTDSTGLFQPPRAGCILFMPGLPGSSARLHDRSPYGNIGTVTGAVWRRTQAGLWYLDFDGVDDSVDCGSGASLDIRSAITLKAWVKWTGSASYPRIIRKAGGDVYGIWKEDTRWRFQIKQGGSEVNVQTGPGTVVSNRWLMLVGTFDGNALNIYVNGTLSATPTNSPGLIDSTPSGAVAIGGSPYWQGGIALVEIHCRAWHALEVQDAFNREKEFFGVF